VSAKIVERKLFKFCGVVPMVYFVNNSKNVERQKSHMDIPSMML